MFIVQILLAVTLTAVSATTSTTSIATKNGTRILILGDSWGTISPATEFFKKKLTEHNCPLSGFTNIAVGGTTAKQWASGEFLASIKKQAPLHDYIWVTLMGNDALAEMPGCAASGKSAAACGDELYQSCSASMNTIMTAIHSANPNAHVVGFGYDTMFGGLGCSIFTHMLFPQCWNNKSSTVTPNRCFNTELVRMQELWERLDMDNEFITAINLLGTTQVAGNVKNSSIGHPNMDEMGPAKYWPITLECIHPATGFGGDTSGAMVIMEEFYKQYWSKVLDC